MVVFSLLKIWTPSKNFYKIRVVWWDREGCFGARKISQACDQPCSYNCGKQDLPLLQLAFLQFFTSILWQLTGLSPPLSTSLRQSQCYVRTRTPDTYYLKPIILCLETLILLLVEHLQCSFAYLSSIEFRHIMKRPFKPKTSKATSSTNPILSRIPLLPSYTTNNVNSPKWNVGEQIPGFHIPLGMFLFLPLICWLLKSAHCESLWLWKKKFFFLFDIDALAKETQYRVIQSLSGTTYATIFGSLVLEHVAYSHPLTSYSFSLITEDESADVLSSRRCLC